MPRVHLVGPTMERSVFPLVTNVSPEAQSIPNVAQISPA